MGCITQLSLRSRKHVRHQVGDQIWSCFLLSCNLWPLFVDPPPISYPPTLSGNPIGSVFHGKNNARFNMTWKDASWCRVFCGCTQYKTLNLIRMRKQARNIHPSPSTSYSNYIHSCSPFKTTHCAKFRLHVFRLLEISISTAISQISPALHTKLYCISISMQLSGSWIIWFVHTSRDPWRRSFKRLVKPRGKKTPPNYGEAVLPMLHLWLWCCSPILQVSCLYGGKCHYRLKDTSCYCYPCCLLWISLWHCFRYWTLLQSVVAFCGKTSSLILKARPPSFLASLKRAKRNMETTKVSSPLKSTW